MQFHLVNMPNCQLPENHPPLIRRQSIFSVLTTGQNPVNLEEFYIDVAFPDPLQADAPRTSLEGLSEQWSRKTGITKFGMYLQGLILGKSLMFCLEKGSGQSMPVFRV